MPHQDALDVTTNAQHLQVALNTLVPEHVLADVGFQEDSRWKPITLACAALLWSVSGETTLAGRFAQALKIIRRWQPEAPPGKSYQGFLKRLRCWSAVLLERIKDEFRRRMQQELREWLLVGGWLVLAGDGSRCQTPRTRSNQQRFAGKKQRSGNKGPSRRRQKQLQAQRRRRRKQTQAERAKKAQSPQIWLTALYVVPLGLPWDWRRGPSSSSEREHLLEMARGLPANALVTFDAGFVGYEFWKTLMDANVTFVGRVGGNVKLLRCLGHVRLRGDLVLVWPDAASRKGQPPLALRLECFRDGKELVCLVSNALDAQRLSTADLKAVYLARWGVELYYRDLKQTFERSKLRSKTADHAELELDWSVLGLWAVNLYASLEHAAAGVAPQRRSVANVLKAFRQTMHEHKSAPDAGEDLWTLLGQALKDDYQRASSKASLNYPHKKRKHPIGAPELVPASAERIEAARKFLDASLFIGG